MAYTTNPETKKRLADETRQVRVARLTAIIKETDMLRIMVGPRHPAFELLRKSYRALREAEKALKSS